MMGNKYCKKCGSDAIIIPGDSLCIWCYTKGINDPGVRPDVIFWPDLFKMQPPRSPAIMDRVTISIMGVCSWEYVSTPGEEKGCCGLSMVRGCIQTKCNGTLIERLSMRMKHRPEVIMKDKEICSLIGCTGTDQKCPGNENCEIIRKIKQCQKDMENDFTDCDGFHVLTALVMGEIMTQNSLKAMRKLSRVGVSIDKKSRLKIKWFLFISRIKIIPKKIKNFFSRKAQRIALDEIERNIDDE
jgi:hypothetical protein